MGGRKQERNVEKERSCCEAGADAMAELAPPPRGSRLDIVQIIVFHVAVTANTR